MWKSVLAARPPPSFAVSAVSCGQPLGASGAVGELDATIEVFPGDRYTAEISFPPFMKKDVVDWKSDPSVHDKQKEEIEKAKGIADEYYESDKEFMKEAGIKRKDVRDFAEEQKKRQLGYIEGPPDSWDFKVTHTDGNVISHASTHEILDWLKIIRKAEYRFKQIQLWIDKLQWGPGVQISVDCQFLVMKLSASWGFKEYMDDRVFFAYKGSVDMDIIKASAKVSAGWKAAGLADALVFFSGEGALGLSVPAIEKEDPDESPKAHVKPRGQLEFAGGLEGTACWVIKAKGQIAITFTAETDDLEVFSERGIISGKVVVKREPVRCTYDLDAGGMFGYGGQTEPLIKGDEWPFEFPPPKHGE